LRIGQCSDRIAPAYSNGMKIIGLIGGVASGKSLVAEQFRRLGAEVLDADRVGHDVLRLPDVRDAIRKHFGDNVFGADGEVDRKALGSIVFAPPPSGPDELAVLEQLTHPEIRRRLRLKVDQLAANGVIATVLDAPVMLKTGWDKFCDVVIYIDAPDEIRRRRAQSRRWTREEFQAREAAQESLDSKRQRADFVVDNSDSEEYTQQQIERIWRSLIG
jgi:dephospho-CoA kinase